MMRRMMLYVDPRWRREALHSPVLFPFWGNGYGESSLFSKELFDSYSFDTGCYGITDDLRQAHLVFAPYRHNWLLAHDPALLEECARRAQEARLPLLIDGMGDIEHPVGIEHAYVLRYGGYRFEREPGRIQMPTFADDLLVRMCGGAHTTRHKEDAPPAVGFAGWAGLAPLQRLRTYIKELPVGIRALFDERQRAKHKGVLWRERALYALRRSPRVWLAAKERRSYSGTSKTAEADLRLLRKEFVDTILESDYALDVRGDANESTRLYEILSLGRIPVIVDTERNLPFGDVVDYGAFSLVVDFRDIDRLPEIIADFHAALAPERFEAMQRAAREAYARHFRIDALMPHVIRQLAAQGLTL